MIFVETSLFTKRIGNYLEDEELAELQSELARNPELGKIIPGSGRIRKLRWAAMGKGQRGGARIIYYWAPQPVVILMLYVYVKSEVGDLTQEQVKLLRSVVMEEFK